MRAATAGAWRNRSLSMNRNKEQDANGLVEEPAGKVRLFVEAPLALGAKVVAQRRSGALSVARHACGRGRPRCSSSTARTASGAREIVEAKKRGATLVCEAQTEPQSEVPDLWLVFAPIKKTPADYVAQKATELGVRVLQPVLTRRTIARRVNIDRLRANAIEAAEQSGRVTVPEIREPTESRDAAQIMAQGPPRLVFCDEAGDAAPIADALASAKGEGDRGPCSPDPKAVSIRKSERSLRANAFVVPGDAWAAHHACRHRSACRARAVASHRRRLAAQLVSAHGGSVGSRRRQHRADEASRAEEKPCPSRNLPEARFSRGTISWLISRRARSRRATWRIGTEHEKFVYSLKDYKPLAYESRPGHPPAARRHAALRLEADHGRPQHHRPVARQRRAQPGAGRTVRALRRAADARS